MAIDIIGSYRKWSLLTAPPIILGGIIGTVIVCDFLFRKIVPDEAVTKCTSCGTDFSAFVRKAEVTHRLSNTKEADSRSAALKSHEDLAKKLQDIDVCYAFVEFEDIAGVQNAIKIKKHGKQADILVQLDALGLKIIQVTADGNCFFRALADQLEGNEDEHMKYRIMVVDFIRDGTWAGHMEIQAVSLVTHSNIYIHQKMSPRWYIQNFDNREAQMIHLSYHDEEHYNSVRLKEDTCFGAARPVTIKRYDPDPAAKAAAATVLASKLGADSGLKVLWEMTQSSIPLQG